jgi:threonine/homoserine/homoserine lactone efflux protein
MTFVAFLPAWVRPGTHQGSVALQLGILGATTVGLALAWFAVVGLSAARIGAMLRRHPGVELQLNRAMGVLLAVLGVALALQKQGS